MAINYPTSLDNWTNPTGADTLATTPHSTHHGNHYDALEALEAKAGINGSAVTTSLDYKVEQGLGGALQPLDLLLKAWTYEPLISSGTNAPAAGTLQVQKVRLPAGTITNLHVRATNTQAVTGAYMGIWAGTAAGALLAQSANQNALFGSITTKTIPLVTPLVVTAGVYYIGLWFTGTPCTIATLAGGTTAPGQGLLGATVPRSGTADTGLTSTFPLTLGTITATTNYHWFGAS